MQNQSWPNSSSLGEPEQAGINCNPDRLKIPTDGTDVWEIDPQHLKFGHNVASGSYGDL